MNKSVLQLVVSSIAFGSVGVFTKLLSHLSIWSVTTYRILFSTLFLGLALLLSHECDISWLKSRRLTLLTLTYSLLQVFCSIYLFTAAIFYTSVIAATVLFFTFPIFSLFFSRIILKEPISTSKLVGLLVGTCGMLCVFLDDFLSSRVAFSWQGSVLALCGAASWALGSVFSKMLRPSVRPLSQTLAGFIISSLIAVITVPLFSNSLSSLLSFSGREWMLFILFGFLTGCVAHLLFNTALSTISVSTANSLMLLEPVAAGILAWFVLGETVSVFLVVGGVLTLIAGFMVIKGEGYPEEYVMAP